MIYESPCRERFLKRDPEILNVTIPQLCVFKTLLHMRKWLNDKQEYEEKMKKLNLPDVPKSEPMAPQSPVASPGKRTTVKLPPPPTDQELAEKEKAEQDAKDKEMFGRYWIWDTYMTETVTELTPDGKPEVKQMGKRDLWQASAQLIRHINKHVIEDMNDFLLMKIFKLQKQSDYEKMHQKVKEMKVQEERDTIMATLKERNIKTKDIPEARELEEGKFKDEDKKRTFCVQMRPPYIWNFFGEEEEKIQHLINPKANPEECYKYEENNRVRRIFDACLDLGTDLMNHEAANWAKLVEHTI